MSRLKRNPITGDFEFSGSYKFPKNKPKIPKGTTPEQTPIKFNTSKLTTPHSGLN